MRLLRLIDPGRFAVELHPFVTVVTALDPEQRERFLSAARDAMRGKVRDVTGLIEAHGVMLDLDEDALRMLELTSADVDVVVAAGELPGREVSGLHRQLQLAQRRLSSLDGAVERAQGALGAAEAAAREAGRRLDEVRRAAAADAAASADGAERLLRLSEDLDELDRRIAQQETDAAEAVAEQEAAQERLRGAVAARGAIEAEHARAAEAVAALEQAVAAARDAVAHAAPDPAELEQIRPGDQRLEDARAGTAPGAAELAAARAALEDARRELCDAEQAGRQPQLAAADVDALEAAHEAVLQAQDRVEGRFGGARAGRRLAEARAAETALLERIGYRTYTDFMMATSVLHADAADEARVAAARERLQAATAAFAALQEKADPVPGAAAVVEGPRTAVPGVRELPGPGTPDPEVVAALRAPVGPGTGATPARALRSALAAVGLAVDVADATDDELVGLADAWLDERLGTHLPVERRLASLHVELAAAQAVAAEMAVRLRAAADAEDDARRAHDDLPGQARAAATARAEAVAARCAVVEAIEQVRDRTEAAASGEAQRLVSDAAAELARADAAVAEAKGTVGERLRAQRELVAEVDSLRASAAGVEGDRVSAEEAEWYLLSRLAAQRHVSFAGSVPLVLDDALRDVASDRLHHLLDRLERMASAVQVIHVTDRPEIVAWARSAGEDRAGVVSPVTPRAAEPVSG